MVDLLEERTAETLSAWLQAHPGVEVINRDRSTEYKRGASEGAPNAIQIADRWHLLQNLRQALERLLNRLSSQLRDLPLPALPEASQTEGVTPAPRQRLRKLTASEQATREASRARR